MQIGNVKTVDLKRDGINLFRVMNEGDMALYVASDLETLMTSLAEFSGTKSGEYYVELLHNPEETQVIIFGLGSSGSAKMVNGVTIIADYELMENNKGKKFAQFLFSSTAENVWICWSGHWYGNTDKSAMPEPKS